jgi:hypothetical protein
VKRIAKYSDDEIRNMPKITIKIAADYLGISPVFLLSENEGLVELKDGPTIEENSWSQGREGIA